MLRHMIFDLGCKMWRGVGDMRHCNRCHIEYMVKGLGIESEKCKVCKYAGSGNYTSYVRLLYVRR